MNEEMRTIHNGDAYVVDHEEAVRKEEQERRIAELNEEREELLGTLRSLEGGDGKKGQREKNQERKIAGEITEEKEAELNERLDAVITEYRKRLAEIEAKLKVLGTTEVEESGVDANTGDPVGHGAEEVVPNGEAKERTLEHDEVFWTAIETLIANIKQSEVVYGPVTNESGKTYSAENLETIIRGIADGSIRDEQGKDKFDYMTKANSLRNTLRQIFEREEKRKGLANEDV